MGQKRKLCNGVEPGSSRETKQLILSHCVTNWIKLNYKPLNVNQ